MPLAKLRWIPLAALPALAGCYSAPRHAAELNLDRPDALASHANDYWDLHDAPSPGAVRPRLALLEFSVEFVTVKKFAPFGLRPVADIGEFSLTGGAAHLAGIGREKLELDDVAMREIPGALRDRFERTLESAGFDVVPAQRIALSPNFLSLEGLAPGEPYAGQFLSPVGSDAGRPKEIRVFPAPGLKVLPRESEPHEARLAAVLAEAGADLGLIVRIRVGADDGFASVERDSRIRLVAADGRPSGRLTALRSLLSDGKIAAGESFQLFSGSVTTADSTLYRDEVQRLADPFLGMAVSALRGPGGTPAAGAISGLTPAQLAERLFGASVGATAAVHD